MVEAARCWDDEEEKPRFRREVQITYMLAWCEQNPGYTAHLKRTVPVARSKPYTSVKE